MERVKQFLKWLNDNQWLNLIFLILAILGIILSIYLYIKSKRKKKPIYSKRSTNVISDSIQNVGDIQVAYLGKKVNNLTVTKIAIWNSGNETINNSDQANSDKLRVESVEGIEIFNAEIIFASTATNNVNARVANNIIELDFDYFDSSQGCILKLIHSGKNSADINVKGTFKGVGGIKEINSNLFSNALVNIVLSPILFRSFNRVRKRKETFTALTKGLPWTMFILGVILCSVYFSINIDSKDGRNIVLILGIVYGLFGLLMLLTGNTLPKKFDSFYDDE